MLGDVDVDGDDGDDDDDDDDGGMSLLGGTGGTRAGGVGPTTRFEIEL